jgi:hypothetical protein
MRRRHAMLAIIRVKGDRRSVAQYEQRLNKAILAMMFLVSSLSSRSTSPKPVEKDLVLKPEQHREATRSRRSSQPTRLIPQIQAAVLRLVTPWS